MKVSPSMRTRARCLRAVLDEITKQYRSFGPLSARWLGERHRRPHGCERDIFRDDSSVRLEPARKRTRILSASMCALLAFPGASAADPNQPVIEADGTIRVPAMTVPLSSYMSEGAQRKFIAAKTSKLPSWFGQRVTLANIAQYRDDVDRAFLPLLEETQAAYPTRVESTVLAGVPVRIVTPSQGVTGENRHRVLLNFHGGGFVAGWGVHSLLESIPLASVARIRVITVNYREGPEHVFPAASEDAASVYSEVLKRYSPRGVGLFGCSAGGVLVAMSVAWFEEHRLPMPGALGIFSASAFADFRGDPQEPGSWGGDSRYVAPALQGEPLLVARRHDSHDAIEASYLAGVDRMDPLVSPGLSPRMLAKFPPTLLLTGTRAYDMSALVQTQRNLSKAGVDADMHLWDGMGHCFTLDSSLPESREAYQVIWRFFDRHLAP